MSDIFTKELALHGIDFKESEPMKDHTTFRIGGPCDFLVSVNNIDELSFVISLCREYSRDYLILGNGSNLLVNDEGLNKVVIRLCGDFKQILIDGTSVKCGAGVTLSKLCTFSLANSLSGLEFAYGIPGTLGGAVYMNAGAYGGEIKDVICSVTHLNTDGEVETVNADDAKLSYRHSIYKENGFVILGAEFKLTADNKDDIKARMDDFMNRRITKQPLEFPSAGSVFKRPVGAYAGALIEQCGFKGYSVGDAQVSEKHSGFIINRGDATCQDVLRLINEIQTKVQSQTGYFLEREIILL